MLFNSYEFLFLFAPIVFFVYFFLGSKNSRIAIVWITFASLFFYAWWDPSSLLLISVSMIVNYASGYRLMFRLQDSERLRANCLKAGIFFNLFFLGYFKYSHFLLVDILQLSQLPASFFPKELPLGVSFFSFVQIAFLVDAYRKEKMQYGASEYGFFVTYFPHLIAGPIIHHKDVIPLLEKKETFRFNPENFSVGLTIFSIGLFKKTFLADTVGAYVPGVFDAPPESGLTMFEAWGGALAYTLQIYFDFSAYSDMALGLSKALNIPLPLNFFSPYQAKSIVDFWRRWHISLSRFLRDYLYISFGGNRKGELRRYLNLFLTMLLGGLWHGAGWTFIAWGCLHGIFLVVNHAWNTQQKVRLPGILAQALTFLCVLIAWVFFRANSFDSAIEVLRTMAGLGKISVGPSLLNKFPMLMEYGIVGNGFFPNLSYFRGAGLAWMLGLLGVALFVPNVAQLFRNQSAIMIPKNLVNELNCRFAWTPTISWAVSSSLLFLIGIVYMNKQSVFLYFQF